MKKLLTVVIFCLSISILCKGVEAGESNKSEVRFMYVSSLSLDTPDWDLIASTSKNYGIDTLNVKIMQNDYAWYNSVYVSHSARDELALAVAAAHARDMELHFSMSVLLAGYRTPDEYKVVDAYGNLRDWVCPTKSASRAHLKLLLEEVVTNYDVDGFMSDYVRWDQVEMAGAMCYCPECKARFEEYLGESIPDSNWPPTTSPSGGGDFAPGGSRYLEFMEWRTRPLNELVKDMRSWMSAIKPGLEFSAATWSWWPGIPTAIRWRIGQDTTYWIKEGYLDWVAPMMYRTDLSWITGGVQDHLDYAVGGPEGTIPLAIFLSNFWPALVAPEDYKIQVDTVRSLGADGWSTWRYGGPGDGQLSTAPDIRPYLDIIDLPDVFSIENIQIFPSKTQATITWFTDKPATSKVEYNTSPLFTASFKLHSATTTPEGTSIPAFNYWDIDHIEGNVVEDSTSVTFHSITLTELQEGIVYYYRVQSQDDSGIATSKVYNFTTIGEYRVNITGIVTDSDTGLPIQGATVICNAYTSMTNSTGGYYMRMTSPAPGSCTLTASKTDYITKSISFPFTENKTYERNFVLNPIKYSIAGKLIDKNNNPVQADIIIYKEGTIVATDQTINGDYSLSLSPDTYDIQFNVSNFYIKLPSVDLSSDITDLINHVTYSSDRLSFITDIEDIQSIQILSSKPNRILLNNSEIGDVSSIPALENNTWYHDILNNNLYLKMSPDLMSDCLSKFDCCKAEERYHDKDCPITTQYCLNRICYPKQPCPYECCVDEEMYLDDTTACGPGEFCSDRTCVSTTTFGKTDVGESSFAIYQYNIAGSIFPLDVDGTVTKISVYLSNTGSGTGEYSAMIYDSSLNFIARSRQTLTLPLDNWYNFTFSQALTSGDYWLFIWGEEGIPATYIYYDTGSPNQWGLRYQEYDGPPDPITSWNIQRNYNMSIYASYSVS